jgi:hypothetical protein
MIWYHPPARVQIKPRDRKDRADVASIRAVGIREVGRRCDLSATTVSEFAAGKLALPLASAQRIYAAAGVKWRHPREAT